jgi:uncharacterized protein (TIGR04255 family)
MVVDKKNSELQNPPVAEAVIDISIESKPMLNLESSDVEDEDFKKNFPVKEPINQFESQFNLSSDSETLPTHTKEKVGYSYKSEDRTVLMQHRINGFSYHKLPKYLGWPEFKPLAMKYWLEYQKLQKNIKIQRLGLRFVNVIDIDGSPESFFKIPSPTFGVSNQVSSFGCKYSLKLDNNYSSTIIVGQIDKQGQKYLLDIDIFKQDISNDISQEEIEKCFDDMREEKNIIFSNILAEKALSNYK